jgi:hypothetical protein
MAEMTTAVQRRSLDCRSNFLRPLAAISFGASICSNLTSARLSFLRMMILTAAKGMVAELLRCCFAPARGAAPDTTSCADISG